MLIKLWLDAMTLCVGWLDLKSIGRHGRQCHPYDMFIWLHKFPHIRKGQGLFSGAYNDQ